MADPMPIGDILKEHRFKWPRLFANVETDNPQAGTPTATPPTRPSDPATRTALAETREPQFGAGGRGLEAQRATLERPEAIAATPYQEPQTRSVNSETRCQKPQIQQQNTETDVPKPLSERLFSLFGGGDNETLRRTLYMRCQLTCQTFGQPALDELRSVCDLALLARNPGNYFAFAIVRRFRELNFTKGV